MASKVFGLDVRKTRQRITEALSFWGESMRLTLPHVIRKKLTVGKEQVIVHLEHDSLHVLEHKHNKVIDLGHFDFVQGLFDSAIIDVLKKQATNDKELILAVSEKYILSKKINFPSAVLDNLKQTLLYEMDKHTPFAKEQVLYDTEITGEHSGNVLANLYILHKPVVADILSRFNDSHIHFNRLCSIDNQNINLLPADSQKKQGFLNFNRNWFLLFLCGILTLVALATPLVLKRHTAIALDKQLAELTPQAEGELELWERRDQSEEALLSFLETHPLPFSQVYEELSKRLPDHTYVTSLEFQNNQVIIRGVSFDAAALIRIINASPLFKEAKILSPIIKLRDQKKEGYHIAFKLIAGGG